MGAQSLENVVGCLSHIGFGNSAGLPEDTPAGLRSSRAYLGFVPAVAKDKGLGDKLFAEQDQVADSIHLSTDLN